MLSTLKDALNSKIKKLKVHHQLKEMQVLALWSTAAGERLAGQTKATRLIRGQLYVKVTSSAWAHQLSFFRREYIRKINDALGEPLVKDIFFQVGDIVSEAEESTVEEERNFTFSKVELDENEKSEISKVAAVIGNEDVQNAFHKFMEKDYMTRKAKKEEGWGKCKVCGSICPPYQDFCWFCEKGRETGRRERVIRWLSETPWLGYDQASPLIPDLSRKEFSQMREEYKITLRNILDGYIAKSNTKISEVEKRDFQHTALAYAMLIAELTPDCLSHDVLSDILGRDLFNRAFSA